MRTYLGLIVVLIVIAGLVGFIGWTVFTEPSRAPVVQPKQEKAPLRVAKTAPPPPVKAPPSAPSAPVPAPEAPRVCRVEGLVVGADDAPVVGAAIAVGKEPTETSDTRSDAKGRFNITLASAADTFIVAVHPRYPRGEARISPRPGETIQVRISLQVAEGVEGTVRRAGQPWANQHVGVEGTSLTAVTDAEGHYSLLNVPFGDVMLRVVHDEENPFCDLQAWFSASAVAEAGKRITVDFDVPATDGTIEGVLSIEDGPAQDLAVTAVLASKWGECSQTLHLGVDGHYRFEHVPAGTISLEAIVLSSPGAERRKKADIELAEAEAIIQDFHFATPGIVYGVVRGLRDDETGLVMAVAGEVGPQVSLEDVMRLNPSALAGTSFSQDGGFRLEGLDPGVYSVVALGMRPAEPGQPPTSRGVSRRAPVTGGREVRVDLSLR